ncbi:MAG: tRNA-queuosine alpha-mannosyltransferase domain-containing protein [Coriobacteriia bacterium]
MAAPSGEGSIARGPLRVLALEPYYGGSHRAVLDGLIARLEPLGITFDVLTLPPRKWKWRMRGSAITMAEEARSLHAAGTRWDVIYASTFVNLAEFVALAGDAVSGVPRIVYLHENQLLYPNRHTADWDYQFALTNITSALTADCCLFNTRYNLDGFLAEIPGFLREFPDHRPQGVAERIAARSEVLAPPFDPTPFDAAPPTRSARPRIVWPHRWEHDKDPEAFFVAVGALAAEGLDFEVAVAGQSFRETEALVASAAASLGERLVHLGEPGSREEYVALLASADIAVSTAINEFFGLAMIEACYAGCAPVVPDRLAYPELYPLEARYRTQEQLVARLRGLITERPVPGSARAIAEPYTFEQLVPKYADVLRRVARAANGLGVDA